MELTHPCVPQLPRHPFHLFAGRGARWSCSATAASSAAAPIPTASVRSATCASCRPCRRSGPARSPATLRQDIVNGGSKFCGDCPLKLPLKKDEPPPQRPLDVGPLPSRLYIECTAACNISCNQACCAPETGITRTRQAGMLDFDLFTARRRRGRAVARPHRLLQLRRGVPAQARARHGRVHQVALPAHLSLHEHQRPGADAKSGARRLARSGIDEVTFSIDGARRRRYVQYRQRGDFAKAIRNLAAAGRREADARARRPVRQLALHPLHAQRQRRGDGAGAADGRRHWRRSSQLGDHRSPGEHVFAALSCPARRSSTRIKREIWDKTDLGNAIPGATPRARIEVGGTSWRDRVGNVPVTGRAGQPVDDPHARHQPLDPAVPGPGQLRPAPRSPRRATLRRRRHRSSTATTSARGCRRTSSPARRWRSPSPSRRRSRRAATS